MAERKRSVFDKLTGRNRGADPSDIERLGEVMNRSVASDPDFKWDGKALASLSRLQMGTSASPGYQGPKTVATEVDYSLLVRIARKCEVVNAILRRTSDDVLANGYMFKLKDDLETGDAEQLQKARDFMAQPNTDNMGDEFMEGLIHDLTLFGDCYIELSGSEDREVNKGWEYGGDLLGLWRISADTMTLLPGSKTPTPPRMAYEQNYKGATRQFTSAKVLHITKHKQGRAYGTSPLISLMGVIAGYLNLQNYIGDLFTGTIPKTILNVGDISNAEMKAMLALIEQQLVGGQSPYGLVTINGGSGFALHKLIDSAKEGQFLDLLYYYREEICAVFGIPPMKLGFVQTGKLSNPETQLDVWYDVVDLMQRRIAQLINTRIMPLLGITDWEFCFNSIRPKRDGERAQILKEQAAAIGNLRQESVISINEARKMLNLEALQQDEARDPFFLSPKLSINMGASNAGGDPAATPGAEGETTGDEPAADVEALFAPPEKKGRRRSDEFVFNLENEITLDNESRDMIFDNIKNGAARDPLNEIEAERVPILNSGLTVQQSVFANEIIDSLDSVFSSSKSITKATPGDVRRAFVVVDEKIALAESVMAEEMTATLTATYAETLTVTGTAIGTDIAFTAADTAALAFWDDVWRLPALENTLGKYRGLIGSVFGSMLENNWSWDKAAREMRAVIDPSGKNYPSYYYERIARTETRRVVENAHLSALVKVGFEKVQRLVEVDAVTDPDLCLPFEESVYSAEEAYGVLPAHPNCRCTLVAYSGDTKPIPDSDVLIPDPDGKSFSLNSKRALTTKDRTPPAGVRKACQVGLQLHEDGYTGDGLEGATVREARGISRGDAITVAKARKMIRWWGRNDRFLDEPKDSPAWASAQLWGGRPGKSWAGKLQRALEADE
tara:strand:+ start:42772 stop:45474 length:2703 start_codon:yes stop_codon:yes gene_type:complete